MGKSVTLTLAFVVFTVVVVLIAFWIHQLKNRIMEERLTYIRSVLTPKMYAEFLDICKNTKNDVYKLVEEAYIKLKNQEAFLDINE